MKRRLLQARLAFHKRKYDFRRKKWLEYKAQGDTAHYWLKKHRDRREAKAAAKNEAQIGALRPQIAKWGGLMDAELKEVVRYRRAIDALRPKPSPHPAGSVVAKEHQLAVEHPECHDGIRKMVAHILVANPGMYITATTGGSHATHSYHWLGRAMDLGANDQHTKDQCGAWCRQNVARGLTEGIHNCPAGAWGNLSQKFGQPVPASYWGSVTWANHINHVHVAV